jgi:Mrp family chromosome partitioning ATPase
MSKSGEIRYVLTSSNTSQGFYTFIPDLIRGLRKIYILKGAPGSGKSTFIRLLGESLSEKGYEIEFWISALDPVNPDGVYIPRLGTAVINGSLPQPIDPRYPGATGHIIYLGDYRNKKEINGRAREIIEMIDRQEEQQNKADNVLKKAGQVREQIKAAARACLNMANIQLLIEELATELLREQPGERHYFASAVTADGVVNYIDEISNECRRRYILKGPPGSGKSLVMAELAYLAREKGYFLEYYHCGLEVDNIVMVIIRNLQLALIDGGDIELSIKPWDVVLDMTAYLDHYDPEAAAAQSSEACRNYEALLLDAQDKLESAHSMLKELKKIYTGFMDFEQLDRRRQEVLEEIISNGSRPQFL